jgi:hypothetical protein
MKKWMIGLMMIALGIVAPAAAHMRVTHTR